MEVSINNNINQLYMSSVRMISSTQQLDSKLIAFYTILTVALSLMLSFKQSRCLLINATTQCSLFKVKKCLKCFKGFKVLDYSNRKKQSRHKRSITNLNSENNQDCINNNINNTNNNNTGITNSFSYTKYLKLKRLRTIASIATKFTANTLKFNSNYCYCLLKKLSFVRMKKISSSSTTVVATAQSDEKKVTRRLFFRFRTSNNNNIINENEIYCPNCETETNTLNLKEVVLKTSSSMPAFSTTHLDKKSSNLHRSNSTSKIYNSKVNLKV